MPNANLHEPHIPALGRRMEHGINLLLELQRPPAGAIAGGIESGLQIEGGEEGGVFGGEEPGFAGERGALPPVLEGEAGEDVEEADMGKILPFSARLLGILSWKGSRHCSPAGGDSRSGRLVA